MEVVVGIVGWLGFGLGVGCGWFYVFGGCVVGGDGVDDFCGDFG